jgi:hypothetical protein
VSPVSPVVAQFEMSRGFPVFADHGIIRLMTRDHDFFVNARRVVEQAIGENIDGSPLVNKGLKSSRGEQGWENRREG